MTPVAPQVLQTTRNLPKEALTLEREAGVSNAGVTSYASPLSFEANFVLYDTGARARGSEFVTVRDGSQHKVAVSLVVQGDETNVPNEGDRITRGGRKFIVVGKKIVSGLEYTDAEPDHTTIWCRDE